MDVRAINKPASSSVGPKTPLPPRPRRQIKWIVVAGIIILLVLSAIGVWLCKGILWGNEKAINRDGYQALFLTNNQVYFGHLKNVDNTYVVITDVYYLQVQQSGEAQKDNGQQLPQEASLSKLGSEVHGPEDTMYIARDQVLFWENLKSDSKVVQAIKQGQKN